MADDPMKLAQVGSTQNAEDTNKLSNHSYANRFLNSEAMLIAAISAWGYAVAFLYELGYAEYYGYPSQLISISIQNIVVAIMWVLFVCVLILFLADQLKKLVPAGTTPFKFEARVFLIVAFFTVALLFVAGYDLKSFMIVLTTLLAIILLNIWPALIPRKDGSTLNERLGALHAKEEKTRSESIFHGLLSILGRYRAIALYFVCFTFAAAYVTALGNAKRQKDHYVITDRSNTVALRIFNSTIITTEFNPCTGRISDRFTVAFVDADHPLSIKSFNIGQLLTHKTSGYSDIQNRQTESIDFMGSP